MTGQTPEPRRVLVLNPKGGCGKTTMATNLACCLAHEGHQVSLVDHDPQGSSSYWLSQRSPDLPSIHPVPMYKEQPLDQERALQLRLPFDTAWVIIDSPAGMPDRHVARLLEQSDLVLMPILPSGIDFQAARHFLTKIRIQRGARPLGIVANRVRTHTRLAKQLIELLDDLSLELVSTLHDLQIYAQLIESGEGIYDRDNALAHAESRSWQRVLDWVKEQSANSATAASGDQHEWQ